MTTDHIAGPAPKHRQEHARQVRNIRRWYWYWRALMVGKSCRPDYNTVPPTREWMIDAGYCLDNTTKGL